MEDMETTPSALSEANQSRAKELLDELSQICSDDGVPVLDYVKTQVAGEELETAPAGEGEEAPPSDDEEEAPSKKALIIARLKKKSGGM